MSGHCYVNLTCPRMDRRVGRRPDGPPSLLRCLFSTTKAIDRYQPSINHCGTLPPKKLFVDFQPCAHPKTGNPKIGKSCLRGECRRRQCICIFVLSTSFRILLFVGIQISATIVFRGSTAGGIIFSPSSSSALFRSLLFCGDMSPIL